MSSPKTTEPTYYRESADLMLIERDQQEEDQVRYVLETLLHMIRSGDKAKLDSFLTLLREGTSTRNLVDKFMEHITSLVAAGVVAYKALDDAVVFHIMQPLSND